MERLRTLLPLVVEQCATLTPSDFSAQVLVVDNDPAASAEGVVRDLGHPRVRYVCEPRPGIANARNRALDESTAARLLAFIDDDESPRPDWLASLVTTWESTGAAAVAGRVIEDFSAPPDPWIVAGQFFRRRTLPTGTPVERAGAGNLLLDLDQVRALGVRFDARLGLSGGEDTLFCAQLRHRRGVIVWCDEAQALDHIPVERLTRRWVLARAYSHGNVAGRVELLMRDRGGELLPARCALAARGLIRVGGGLLRGAFGMLGRDPRHAARGLRTMSRGLGMAAAAAGRHHEEYRRAPRPVAPR